ncbi:flagellar protein FlgN [Novosphingobium aquimarinum]|uniref:flagellar protein FlgN n=1 Tax=Novosphingobium aquimarinum TaxID=2682494 RepID=UPI001E4E2F58|nr:flagellar protein FlgN [Novosphingobium aquimarinum]
MSRKDLRDALRQMVAVLEAERQALAGLDLDAIVAATTNKDMLCNVLGVAANDDLDEECLGLIDAARRLNEINRQVRNLVAANVSARLNSLTGGQQLYSAGPRIASIGVRA